MSAVEVKPCSSVASPRLPISALRSRVASTTISLSHPPPPIKLPHPLVVDPGLSNVLGHTFRFEAAVEFAAEGLYGAAGEAAAGTLGEVEHIVSGVMDLHPAAFDPPELDPDSGYLATGIGTLTLLRYNALSDPVRDLPVGDDEVIDPRIAAALEEPRNMAAHSGGATEAGNRGPWCQVRST